jgi:uncharacterized protein YecE (DUF72 family)
MIKFYGRLFISKCQYIIMPVLVGTSGWSYDDWVGAFYPPHLKKDEWLNYYAKYFNTVEINSTYYSFPLPGIVNSWISKASKLSCEFEYSLKMPGKVTHETLLENTEFAVEFEKRVVKPFYDAGCLGVVLIQLSPYFRLMDKGKNTGHIERLKSLLETIDTKKYGYVVEFRHFSWLHEGWLMDEVKDLLKEFNVASCAVDGPGMPGIIENTASHAYIRFHGRNSDIWFDSSQNMEGRMNRYDYDYTDRELFPWKSKIDVLAGKTKNIRVYFNNHPRANAVKNAMMMEKLLGIKAGGKKMNTCSQSSLSKYE